MHERQTLYNDPEVVEKVHEFMSFLFTDAELQRLETEGVAPDLSTLDLSRHRSPLAVHAMMYINAALGKTSHFSKLSLASFRIIPNYPRIMD